jgi:hypothetical protein
MHPGHGRPPGLAALATLLIGLVGLLGIPALAPDRAQAHPGNVPGHAIGNWFYDSYGLGVYPPRYMRSYRNVTCWNGELVKWSPDLYRWNGRSWVLYDGTAPWYQAVTSNSGYCPFAYGAVWLAPNGGAITFRRIGKLPIGYYAVLHYMYWATLGRTHTEWSNVFQLYSPASGSGSAFRRAASGPPPPTRADAEGHSRAP